VKGIAMSNFIDKDVELLTKNGNEVSTIAYMDSNNILNFK
jgi:hypothetical protein